MRRVHDAETGEEVPLTLSRWSKTDGRVDTLAPRSFIPMGTGKLLRQRLSGEESVYEHTASPSPHPIIRQFEEYGPLDPLLNLATHPRSRPTRGKRRVGHLSPKSPSPPLASLMPLTKPIPPNELKAPFMDNSNPPPKHTQMEVIVRDNDLYLEWGESNLNWDLLEEKYYSELRTQVSILQELSPEHSAQGQKLEARCKTLAWVVDS